MTKSVASLADQPAVVVVVCLRHKAVGSAALGMNRPCSPDVPQQIEGAAAGFFPPLHVFVDVSKLATIDGVFVRDFANHQDGLDLRRGDAALLQVQVQVLVLAEGLTGTTFEELSKVDHDLFLIVDVVRLDCFHQQAGGVGERRRPIHVLHLHDDLSDDFPVDDAGNPTEELEVNPDELMLLFPRWQ